MANSRSSCCPQATTLPASLPRVFGCEQRIPRSLKPGRNLRHLRQWRRARRNRNRHRIAHQRSFLAADQPPESFNLFNRLNRRFQLTDDGTMSNAARFNYRNKAHWNQLLPCLFPGADEFHEGHECLRSSAIAVCSENVVLKTSPSAAKARLGWASPSGIYSRRISI